ncbi:MAG TPA: glycerol kinase [Sphingobium sp.]|uniref:FGGY family carbohydrate kinase n=1 Tax=Sphingobium sp. TaxID=1912891 RepID=UPI002ED53A3E
MMERWLLVLDEGTTSTRAMLYGPDGRFGGVAQEALEQYYPQPGWVEHDAEEILTKTLHVARQMVEKAGGADRIAAIGITNQRETVVAWDRETGKALGRAIVWQDRRGAAACDALREKGLEPGIQAKTGLILDPYFSANKMGWMLANRPEVAAAGDRLALGTVESWLVWHLTGGAHVSDASNASRTSLLALDGQDWDPELCEIFGVPRAALPRVVGSAETVGTTLPDVLGGAIPICGLAGDQQAATIGQGCLSPGETKATFGTGAFILANMGTTRPHSTHRLLGTVLCDVGGVRTYALEGSVFVAGSLIKWLRDNLGLIAAAQDTDRIARSVPDNGGVVFLPALVGLGAPHWRPAATASITGMSQATTAAHIVRAALESMAHQCHDLKEAFAADGAPWNLLRIDGGMSGNDWLAQDLADILDVPLERPTDVETTARGAAMLAAVGAGFHASLEDAKAMLPPTKSFRPQMSEAIREARLAAWRAVLPTG